MCVCVCQWPGHNSHNAVYLHKNRISRRQNRLKCNLFVRRAIISPEFTCQTISTVSSETIFNFSCRHCVVRCEWWLKYYVKSSEQVHGRVTSKAERERERENQPEKYFCWVPLRPYVGYWSRQQWQATATTSTMAITVHHCNDDDDHDQ